MHSQLAIPEYGSMNNARIAHAASYAHDFIVNNNQGPLSSPCNNIVIAQYVDLVRRYGIKSAQLRE